MVIVNIDGNDVPLIFESGNSGAVALTQPMIDRLKALPTGETSQGMDSRGNVIEYPRYKISRLQIGTAVFTDVIGELDVHDPSYQATQVGQRGLFWNISCKEISGCARLRASENDISAARQYGGSVRGLQGNSSAFFAGVARKACRRAGNRPGSTDSTVGYWEPTSLLSKRFVQSVRSSPSGDSLKTKRLTLGGTDYGPWQFELDDLS